MQQGCLVYNCGTGNCTIFHKHSESQKLFSYLNAQASDCAFAKRHSDRTENSNSEIDLRLKWAVISAVHGLTKLHDHDSQRDVLTTLLLLLRSLSRIGNLVSDSFNFPPKQYLYPKNTTSHDNHGYSRSCRGIVGSVSSEPCFKIDSRRHRDLARCGPFHQCHRCQGSCCT